MTRPAAHVPPHSDDPRDRHGLGAKLPSSLRPARRDGPPATDPARLLTGPRVALAPTTRDDVEALHRIATDPLIGQRWRMKGRATSADEFQRVIWADAYLNLTMRRRRDEAVIGLFSLALRPRSSDGADRALATRFAEAGMDREDVEALLRDPAIDGPVLDAPVSTIDELAHPVPPTLNKVCWAVNLRQSMTGGASGWEIASQTVHIGYCTDGAQGGVVSLDAYRLSYGVSTYGSVVQGVKWDDPPQVTKESIVDAKGSVRQQGHLDQCLQIGGFPTPVCHDLSSAILNATVGLGNKVSYSYTPH